MYAYIHTYIHKKEYIYTVREYMRQVSLCEDICARYVAIRSLGDIFLHRPTDTPGRVMLLCGTQCIMKVFIFSLLYTVFEYDWSMITMYVGSFSGLHSPTSFHIRTHLRDRGQMVAQDGPLLCGTCFHIHTYIHTNVHTLYS